MLFLVRADGHHVGHVKQNVRRHQHRIGEKTGVDVVRVFGGLVLKLGHPLQFAHVGKAAQIPVQLRVLVHMALEINDIFLGIQPAGQENGHGAQAGLAQLGGILPDGEGMHVHDGIQAVVFILQQLEIAQCADIVAQGQLARRLNAGKNPLFLLNIRFHVRHLHQIFHL